MNIGRSESFGSWVRKTREDKGIKQGELAQLMGLGQSYVSKIELDEREPSADFAVRFARAVQLSTDYVLAKAGLIGEDVAAHGESESPAAQKIRALVAMLDSEDQERAIQLLETLVRTRKQSAPVKPARSRAGSGA